LSVARWQKWSGAAQEQFARSGADARRAAAGTIRAKTDQDIAEEDLCHRAEGRKCQHAKVLRLSRWGAAGTSPSHQSKTIVPMIGTASATIIKSSPSMKCQQLGVLGSILNVDERSCRIYRSID
jgi:hypothetical protein